MTVAKVQHYVPQFLLRNFGAGKKNQIWVFDKVTDRSFLTNARNVASESRFYDFDLDGEPVTLEPMLSKIEAATKPVIEKILKADTLAVLDNEDRDTLATFLAIQLARTRNMREQWMGFPGMLRRHLEAHGQKVADGSQAAQLIQDLSENQSKAETGKFLLDAPSLFADHLLSKDWLLAMTSTKHPFMISDNPLTRQNMFGREHRGNLGLTVPGVEVYLPLSPLRALVIWCTSIADAILEEADRIPGVDRTNAPEIFVLADAVRNGRPLPYAKEHVENFNSLQIAQSERYVFSSRDSFELAREMVTSHPKLRSGPRMESMGDTRRKPADRRSS